MQITPVSIGRYEILDELGRGAMGIVYKARDPRIDRLVAIKTISLFSHDSSDEKDFRNRLFIEAQAAGRLSHPSIVTIFDVGEEPDTLNPYVVMEYVAGPSLEKELYERADHFALPAALSMIEQLAEALDYAHSQGIVHCDIKPANILLAQDGRPKITDFGVARVNLAYHALPGHAVGTPAYMSPEQLNGENVDGRSDLFSLGVVLYTLLTGYRPFQGNTALTVSFKVVNRNPLPATAFNSAFPAEIDHIISRAMAKDPAQRYQTGSEMAADLRQIRERILSDAQVSAPAVEPETAASTVSQAKASRVPTARAENTSPNDIAKSRTSDPSLRIVTWFFVGAAVVMFLLFGIAGVTYHRRFFTPVWPANPENDPTPPSVNLATSTPAGLQTPRQATAKHTKIQAAGSAHTDRPKRLTDTSMVQKHPSTNSAAPRSPAATTAMPPSLLRLRIEDSFTSAELQVWIDDKPVYSSTVSGIVKKRLVVFKGVQAYRSDSVPVSAGNHRFRVRVHALDDSYDQSSTLAGIIPSEGERQLFIECTKHKPIHLELQ